MRLLLTNDDGIKSPGLDAVRHIFQDEHEIWIVAPDGQRSGCSQAITLRRSVRTKRVSEHTFSCTGTPVDCVNIACTDLMAELPDVVISGINLGPNIGTDIGYSGTAAAARQGAYRDIPSIAISVFSHGPQFLFGAATTFLQRHFEEMVDSWSREFFYNVNTPNTDGEVADIAVCDAAEVRYDSGTASFDAPKGERYHFYEGELITTGVAEDSDLHAVIEGKIAVSYVTAAPAVSVKAGATFPNTDPTMVIG